MKAELLLPPELVDQIADKVIERLLPVMVRQQRTEDKYMDVKELSHYLSMSRQWIHNNKGKLSNTYYISGKPLWKKSEIDTLMSESKPRKDTTPALPSKSKGFKEQQGQG